MATEMVWNQLATDLGCITPPHTNVKITGHKTSQDFPPHPVLAKGIHTFRTETLASLLPVRAKDLSAPLVTQCHQVIAKEIHAIPSEALACYFPVRAKDLSAPHINRWLRVIAKEIYAILTQTLASFLPGPAKNLSGPQINQCHQVIAKNFAPFSENH